MSYTQDRGQPADTASMPGWRLGTLVIAAALALSACNDKNSPIKAQSEPQAQAPTTAPQAQQTEAEAALPAPAPAPPSAQALYQMVAPIALYPDKLVAQILAGATYPDQIAAAESWLAQNPGLQKTALANAVSAQSWDPSIKSLTQFPNVLGQLASNLPWTTALGRAYYNEPADVMNAIQVMRNRAYQAGTLKNSRQLKVSVAPQPTSPPAYVPSAAMTTPAHAPVLMQPEQYIEIQPSLPDTVYVPQYNPSVVYGEPMPVYGGYRPLVASAPSVATPVVAGLVGFGAGILLSRTEQRHPAWGWNSWDMHWGEPSRHWRAGDPPPPPRDRPAVVYNNTTYVSQSHTVVQNIHRTDNLHVTNIHEGFAGAAQAPVPHELAWHDKAAMPPPTHPLAEASAPSAGQHAAAMAGAGGAALAAGAYAMRRPPSPALAQDTRPPAGAQTAQGLPGREPASSTMRPATSLAVPAPRGTAVPAPGAVRPDNGHIATPRPMPPSADTHAGTGFPSGQTRTPAMQQMQDQAQQRQAQQQERQMARQPAHEQQMQAQRQAMQQDRQMARLQAQQAREQQQMQVQRQAMQQDRQTARLQAQQAREQQQVQAQHQAMQQEQQMARLQAQQAREQQQIQAQRQAAMQQRMQQQQEQQEQQMARAQAQQQERQAHMQAQARAQQDQQMRSQQRQQQMAAGHAERQHGERNRREQH